MHPVRKVDVKVLHVVKSACPLMKLWHLGMLLPLMMIMTIYFKSWERPA
jgi:hypothetical protein